MQKIGLLFALSMFAAPVLAEPINKCKKITPAEFAKQSVEWRGRTLIASASWCSSCKTKLMAAHEKPDDYVILVAFDDAKSMETVLQKFVIASPCIISEELVEELKIQALPWQSKI